MDLLYLNILQCMPGHGFIISIDAMLKATGHGPSVSNDTMSKASGHDLYIYDHVIVRCLDMDITFQLVHGQSC